MHYLWVPHRSLVYLVFVYSKDEADTLSADQNKVLRGIVGSLKRELSR